MTSRAIFRWKRSTLSPDKSWRWRSTQRSTTKCQLASSLWLCTQWCERSPIEHWHWSVQFHLVQDVKQCSSSQVLLVALSHCAYLLQQDPQLWETTNTSFAHFNGLHMNSRARLLPFSHISVPVWSSILLQLHGRLMSGRAALWGPVDWLHAAEFSGQSQEWKGD